MEIVQWSWAQGLVDSLLLASCWIQALVYRVQLDGVWVWTLDAG